MKLTWTIETMPGPWIGDEYRYAVTTAPSGRAYREHESTGLQAWNGRYWESVDREAGQDADAAILANERRLGDEVLA
jgi:hypothetical protein